jgi:4-hydroxybenzoate polyprenyltransferase
VTRLRHLLEMIRFGHTLFALPFALLAAVMAWAAPAAVGIDTHFRWSHLVGILLCMVFARSAAMAFNRLADRKLDAHNPRTSSRHLPAGILSVGSVVGFTIVSATGFLLSTLIFLPNRLPVLLALPVLLFLFGYSYAKRFTSLAHFWLGTALMLAPVSAWIAIRGEVLMAAPSDLLAPLVLGTAVLLWVAGFDIIYACQDTECDIRAQLHSVPAALGVSGALKLAAACHVGMIVVLALLPLTSPALGWLYGLSIASVAVLLMYEHWLVRPDDLTRVNIAFFQVNAVVSIGLFLVGAVDLLW